MFYLFLINFFFFFGGGGLGGGRYVRLMDSRPSPESHKNKT